MSEVTLNPLECALGEAQALRGQVDALQAENAKLREEFTKMDQWHSAELIAALDENAKLRELVRIAVKHCDSGTCDGCPIMGKDESCPYSDMARELGVEVDDG